MACYTVPLIAAVMHYFMRKKHWKVSKYHKWLNFLFAGAGIFGVIDHLWNGELFMFNFADLLLGLTITVSIIVAGLIMVYIDKARLYNVEKNIN